MPSTSLRESSSWFIVIWKFANGSWIKAGFFPRKNEYTRVPLLAKIAPASKCIHLDSTVSGVKQIKAASDLSRLSTTSSNQAFPFEMSVGAKNGSQSNAAPRNWDIAEPRALPRVPDQQTKIRTCALLLLSIERRGRMHRRRCRGLYSRFI